MPYEIGGANGRRKGCAHLIDKRVTKLPSYIKVAPIVLDPVDLKDWLDKTMTSPRRIKAASSTLLESYLPTFRSESEITFY
jgi:hypothetical protein